MNHTAGGGTLSYPEAGVRVEYHGGRDTTQDRVFGLQNDGLLIEVLPYLSEQPEGIRCCVTNLGITQTKRPDFAVVELRQGGRCAAMFTRNLCPSVTVLRNRALLRSGRFRAIAVNSGNANVFTPTASADLVRVESLLSTEFGFSPDEVMISSTGRIGIRLPVEKFERGVPGLREKLREQALEEAAVAILTTDLGPKTASVRWGDIVLCGIAKGAGMVEPNLATMLVYLFTNARLGLNAQSLLEDAVALSLNRISIDSDMSTNDTVALFSTESVALGQNDLPRFQTALRALAIKLARDIVSQGEGVTKIIEASVRCDMPPPGADLLSKQVVNSPLVKAAIHGADPNWGRVVMALGKPIRGVHERLIDPSALRLSLQGAIVYDRGKHIRVDLDAVSRSMRESRVVEIEAVIGKGGVLGRAWGCDLSSEYVQFNSEHTT